MLIYADAFGGTIRQINLSHPEMTKTLGNSLQPVAVGYDPVMKVDFMSCVEINEAGVVVQW